MAIKTSIGVLGGTFDPIHFAHLRLAEEVAEAFRLNTVRLIPSANPPHRITPSATAEDRLKMVKLALDKANEKLVPDGRELNRIGKSYMVDTLNDIRTEYSDASINLILGTDAFVELVTWHNWQQLFSLANIIVASRPNLPLSELETNLEQKLATEYEKRKRHDRDLLHSSRNGLIFNYEFTSLEVSGTSLRKRIRQRQSLKYLLPDNVINYIQNHNLYDTVGGTLGNCDVYAARAAAQEILDDDLEMVIGPMCSFVEEVDDVFNWITDDNDADGGKIYSPSGVSIISPIQYNNNRDVFGFQPFTWGETYANALSDNGISTPALVYTDDDYGRDFIDSFKSAWEESGGSYCLSVGYGTTPTNDEFVNIVEAIYNAGCDSIVLGSHMADGANILSYHAGWGSDVPILLQMASVKRESLNKDGY